jgi:hypothetical protein
MSNGATGPNVAANNEANAQNQNIVQNGSGQEQNNQEQFDVFAPYPYEPCKRDSEGRPVLVREPVPAPDGHLDTSNMFGELALTDILGQGDTRTDFSTLLDTGRILIRCFVFRFRSVSFITRVVVSFITCVVFLLQDKEKMGQI